MPVALLMALTAAGSPGLAVPATTDQPLWAVARPDMVCAMSGTWLIGIGKSAPNVTNVNIEFTSERGARRWQAIHRGVAFDDLSYDVTVVDAGSLAPLETRNTGPVPPVHFRFAGRTATSLDATGAVTERIELGDVPMPEGPGLEILAQAIPWRKGLVLRATLLDRWRGQGDGRARAMSWRVIGVETRELLIGRQRVFRTRLVPDDGAFAMTAFVTASRPHHIVRIEYQHTPDRPVMVSELREAAFQCGPSRFAGI